MNYAIILSGGTGSRMNMPGTVKQYILVEGKPILVHTLERFEKCSDVDKIVIVADVSWRDKIDNWIKQYSISKFVEYADPGIQRQSSILNGLNKCLKYSQSEEDTVIIHDAARPMVSIDLISKCITTAKEQGGCMPVLPMTDTIYFSSDGEKIERLLDRNTLFAGQSPEAFNLWKYAELNNKVGVAELNAFKGTSEIAYKYGLTVRLIPGEVTNYKITTSQDLERFMASCHDDARL